MDRRPVDRILDEWNAVANQARRPAVPPRRVAVRSRGLSTGTLAGASLMVIALVAAGLWLGRPGPTGIGSVPSATPDPTMAPLATPSPLPTPSTSPEATASATPSPSPRKTAKPSAPATASPAGGPCDPADLSARITSWEGAAGHRIAHVELTNTGSRTCGVRAMARPQLVDGRGSVLIEGANAPASGLISVAPGGVLTTLVQDGNYCGPAPQPPVSVAFVLKDGGRIVAHPLSPTDATLPPCNGPGSPADIEMQPWAR
jgi:hypothetical protein